MSSANVQQDCVCDLSVPELNELDKVEFQGRDDDYAPGVILVLVAIGVHICKKTFV